MYIVSVCVFSDPNILVHLPHLPFWGLRRVQVQKKHHWGTIAFINSSTPRTVWMTMAGMLIHQRDWLAFCAIPILQSYWAPQVNRVNGRQEFRLVVFKPFNITHTHIYIYIYDYIILYIYLYKGMA